jgi:hypothetical protein
MFILVGHGSGPLPLGAPLQSWSDEGQDCNDAHAPFLFFLSSRQRNVSCALGTLWPETRCYLTPRHSQKLATASSRNACLTPPTTLRFLIGRPPISTGTRSLKPLTSRTKLLCCHFEIPHELRLCLSGQYTSFPEACQPQAAF